ncbi:cyclase family protein [Ornithinimicrobium cerasi]|uniref:cyclase family protein n=1 Tax=Ornithinimicrobium cerasi TaxID=2248773 RepID=UPI00192A5A21|nr:cyclase family protein [Ornithinimicrobium cerasi]
MSAEHRPPPDRSESTVTRVELSHAITGGMATYPGLPAPEFTAHLTRSDSRRIYAAGTEFTIDRITMVGNTGTYLDSPLHRYADGTDLSGLPLDALVDLPTVVVDLVGRRSRAVGVELLAAHDVDGCAVLLHTGAAARWGTAAYAEDAPYLTEEGARWLVGHGARLVGIDAVNLDDFEPTSGGRRPAHSVLLAAGIPVVENLTGLEQVPATGARFTAAPPMLAGVGTFPVRAYASFSANRSGSV